MIYIDGLLYATGHAVRPDTPTTYCQALLRGSLGHYTTHASQIALKHVLVFQV